MRIPKRVNTVLDWMEQHSVALGAVTALVVVALVALLVPSSVGIPAASFLLGLALGGFTVHVRSSRRVRRARAEVDNLLRENGALRHRNTVLASGVITREAQETQALMSIPEDDLLLDGPPAADEAAQRTVSLDELLDGDPQTTDELPEELADEPGGDVPAPAAEDAEQGEDGERDGEAPGDEDMQRTTVLTELPDSLVEEAAKNYRRA
ncbi:hypothetical protein [Actinomadura livida]|uniref:Uncharacterized protein n=1 Tax=Actinomadura livida TaxID=79909 RepID=A0A7W7N115_9ACTN|nr:MULTISPECIES: hypothetical protein [Actinomadura]MBB4777472.1 hypothetical protein [Actinomadura catellatispora]GGU31277.1 hypothetical protein GCM10010208_64990 [Actinomadura livida]